MVGSFTVVDIVGPLVARCKECTARKHNLETKSHPEPINIPKNDGLNTSSSSIHVPSVAHHAIFHAVAREPDANMTRHVPHQNDLAASQPRNKQSVRYHTQHL